MAEYETFEVEGRTYSLAYNLERIGVYENSHPSLMSSFVRNRGYFPLAELVDLTACGLKEEGGTYVPLSDAKGIATNLVQEHGALPVNKAVGDALGRDCGFLFKVQGLKGLSGA